MSDRCSCVDGPNYRCGIGRPCNVHGNVDALMARGEYVDRRRRTWAIVGFGGGWGLVDERGFAMGGILAAPAQMRRRIVREQHREVCPGLHDCDDHPVPHVLADWLDSASFYAFPGGLRGFMARKGTLSEAIDAAQQLAEETT